ncbi:MAG TPA: hypothetical protein VIW28_14300 [Gemmatimonadales bacterium]|jgi:hypothetical protein
MHFSEVKNVIARSQIATLDGGRAQAVQQNTDDGNLRAGSHGPHRDAPSY